MTTRRIRRGRPFETARRRFGDVSMELSAAFACGFGDPAVADALDAESFGGVGDRGDVFFELAAGGVSRAVAKDVAVGTVEGDDQYARRCCGRRGSQRAVSRLGQISRALRRRITLAGFKGQELFTLIMGENWIEGTGGLAEATDLGPSNQPAQEVDGMA